MTVVVLFRARPAEPAPAPVPPAVAPEEIAEAMRAIDRAVVALGPSDFESLNLRLLAAARHEADAEPDNSADAQAMRRELLASVLMAASAFRNVATTVARLRAEA